ncbi:hypothetical protein PPS11_03280 [Pseudomonas putida S11]|nr:hypothetical protein PPS11_03280 [Pseudomonas putida S11]
MYWAIGALGPADSAGHAENLLAEREALYCLAQFDDRTGQIQTKHRWQRLTGVRPCTRGNLGIERVYSSGVNADKDLASSGNRARNVANDQWGLGGLGDGGKHGLTHDGYLCSVDAYRLRPLTHSDKKLNSHITHSQ